MKIPVGIDVLPWCFNGWRLHIGVVEKLFQSLSTLRVYQLYVFVLRWRLSPIEMVPNPLEFINPFSLSTLCLHLAVEIISHRDGPQSAGVYQPIEFINSMSSWST